MEEAELSFAEPPQEEPEQSVQSVDTDMLALQGGMGGMMG